MAAFCLVIGVNALLEGEFWFLRTCILMAAVIAAPAGVWQLLARQRGRCELRVEKGRLGGPWAWGSLALGDIAKVEPRRLQGLYLLLDDGTEIDCDLEKTSLDEAKKALQFDPATRTVRIPIQRFPSSSLFGIVSMLVGPIPSFYLLATLLTPWGGAREFTGWALLGSFVLAGAIAVIGGRRLQRRRVELSLDGIRIFHTLGERFFPASDVLRVEDIEDRIDGPSGQRERIAPGSPPFEKGHEKVELVGFRVHLRSGDPIELEHLTPELLGAARQALTRLLASNQESWAPHRVALARGSSSVKEWQRALRERHEGAPGYREGRLPEDELEACLLDASAPPDVRLGAAVALQASGSGAKQKLRVAAERCENPALARALEAVRDDRLDEALVAAIEQQTARS
jgi:hypothetical protein